MSAYADLGTLWINIGAKNKTGEEFDKIRQSAAKVGKDVEALGKKFTNYLTLPLTGIGALAINEFAKFESSMSKVQATTQATSSEMAILTAKARELGKSTIYSAEDVAEAMNYMAMAGWDTSQIIDGLGGVLDLAAASGGDLATVSDIVTDALTAFGLGASDTTDFVDLLANVARTANTNVELLGESFKYVAPVSASLGITAEQTALALGLLANNGIKGSQAGTTLRAALNQLIKPSTEAAKLMKQYGIAVQTADDGSVDLMATIGSLKQGISGLSREQQAQVISTLVGTEAMSGMMALINSSEADVNKLTEATTNYSGSAKEMAETMNNNVKGNLNKLKSAFSELLIVVGENLVPIFTKLIEKATEVVEWFGSLDEGTQEFIVKMGLLSATIGPVLSVVGKLTSALTPVNQAFDTTGGTVVKTVIPALTGAGGLIPSLTSLVSCLTGPVGLALAGGVAGFMALRTYAKETATLSFDETVSNIRGISEATAEMVIAVTDKWDLLKQAQAEYTQQTEETSQEAFDALYSQSQQFYQDTIDLTTNKYDEQIEKAKIFSEGMEGEEKLRAEKAVEILEQQKLDEVTKYETLKDEALGILTQLNEGTITNKEQAIARLEEIAAEFNAREVESEINSAAELQALKENGYKLEQSRLAEHASEVITKSKEVVDAKIADAEAEFEEKSRLAEEIKKVDKELAEQLIQDAEQTKNDKIRLAQEEHIGILEELGATYPELSNIVSLETGKQKTFWEQLFSGVTTSNKKEIDNVKKEYGILSTTVEEESRKMEKGLNSSFAPYEKGIKEAKNYGKKVEEAQGKVEKFSTNAASSLDSPFKATQKLKEELNSLPTKKTINVTVNETTNKRTKVYASENVARSYALRDAIGTHDFEGLYNLTAFNTGFNPSDEIARYESNDKATNNTQTLSTKNLEDKIDELIKYFKEFGSMKVFLDKYTLVGELAPEMSKELAKGVRFR